MPRKGSENKEAICAVLDRLRNAKPNYRDIGAFSRAAEIAPATITAVAEGDHTPTLPIIEKWLDKCGVSLSDFFRAVESEAGISKSKDDEIEILYGYEHFYRLLNGIIKGPAKFWTNSIEGNLYGMYIATGQALPTGVPKPPLEIEEHGSDSGLSPPGKERKKRHTS